MLRIGMSGTGGVGKTTVLNAIRTKYPHLVQPVSSARWVFARRGITEAHQRTMSNEDLLELQEEITSHWLQQSKNIKEDSVWDRTMLDHYAYGMVRNHKYVTEEWINKRTKQVISDLHSYTHFFFFPQPNTWKPEYDNIRDSAPGTRKLVDLTIKGFLAEQMGYLNVSYVPTDDSPQQVVEFVLSQLP